MEQIPATRSSPSADSHVIDQARATDPRGDEQARIAVVAFERGDIQFLHNHVILHTRTAFEDWPEPKGRRHLLRLWLRDDRGQPVVPLMRESFQGIHVAGFHPVIPLDDVSGAAV